MKQTKQWYVVYTKTGEEQKVCDALLKKKLESFYPAKKTTKTCYGRERTDFRPLFERYVFVLLTEQESDSMKQVNGILNFAHWLSRPVVIGQESIYLLKRFVTTHNNISVEKVGVNPAELASVSVTHGEDCDEIHLNFPALGYVLTAQENKTRVKVITIPNYPSKTNSLNRYAETR